MNYKTQVFTEQQLKEFFEKGKTTTIEPVKKDERIFDKDWKEIDSGLGQVIIYDPIKGKSKTICKVGELVQAVVKGEKQWYCPECNEIRRTVGLEIEICFEHSENNLIRLEPLLVRLEKIEGKKTIKKHKGRHTKQWRSVFDNPDCWLKTWGRKE